MNAVFTREKLDNLDKLVDAIIDLTINDSIYELNTTTASDEQGDLTNNPDIVNHTSNVIFDQTLFSFWTIGEVSVLPPPTNLSIATIILAPPTLLMIPVKEIYVGVTSGNAWTTRTSQKISTTGVGGSIPISTPIHSGTSKYATPASIDSTGTSITIGTSDNTTAPPCGLNASPKIGNIHQFATPDLRNSNKLNSGIDENFPYTLGAPPIITEVLCDKLSDSTSWDIYTRCCINLTADPVNIPAPKFMGVIVT